MRRWSELAERVAATTRTSEKTRLIADYLRSLPPSELVPAAHFLAGRPFAQGDGRATGIGWATIAAVVREIAGAGPEALRDAYDRSSDLGTAVGEVLTASSEGPHGIDHEPPGRSPVGSDAAHDVPTPAEASVAFAAMQAASGPARKGAILGSLLSRADPLSAKYLVRILTGELRIGLREGLLEAAIAEAFERPLADVKWAGMLTGDIGATALLARDDRLDDARLTLFRPLKFMLASPAEDADEIVARLGPTVWVEDKYDGIRAQLHRQGDDVRLYSRDLHDISGQFPEIVASARRLGWDGILDGEILAYRDGAVLPFLALQSRLGRKDPSDAVRSAVPVVYVAFDLLAVGPHGVSRNGVSSADVAGDRISSQEGSGDGFSRGEVSTAAVARNGVSGGSIAPEVEPLIRLPLSERRRRLEALGLPLVADGGGFALSHLASCSSADELEALFLEARARRNEGLMVKDPTSGYSPGRRGLGWLKMKKALATLDCVVVGVEVGHGKRHGVLSDYTFAVREDATGELVTIGKAYSGLTDAEIAEMTRWFEEHTLRRLGRYRMVEPTVVVEVAFDVIMRSSRHKSGFALRFPRIARLRTDKSPDEIDTLETVEAIFAGLQHGAEHLVTATARR